MTLPTRGLMGGAIYIKRLNCQNSSSLLPQIYGKTKCMVTVYDVHETLYVNSKIHGPLVRGSDPRAGQYDHITKIY